MFEVFSYTFFQKALIAWLLISLVSWVLGSLVVLRQEPNITHSIANILFLGIVISFFFSWDYYLFGIIFAILWAIVVWGIERYTPTSRESSKEIISQIWLAGWIFGIWMLWNIQIDIFNFLFGSILFVENIDIYALLWILLVGIILWWIFWKKLLRIALSSDIAKSQWMKTGIYEIGYLLYLSIFIAVSLKIFWVLLLGAFLVLPGNIGKTLSKSLHWVLVIATIVSMISVVIWLLASYYFDTSAWATIVLMLGIIFLIASLLQKRK